MIHRLVSVLKAIEKRYKPRDAACERRSIRRDGISTSRRGIVQVIVGHTARCAEAPIHRFADGLSATVCKAACLNTQQTVKNDVNRPYRGASVLRGSFYSKAFSQTGM
ncbi:hypothetical protein [Paraburkholderia fungorum]|jgi:hypothetical protein|uniref:Uncharacterized protein n=1 Tax=Paraburkholderia fungorum TaxID=134537 RepID=A0AAW3V2J8_9BURK|nr:hypothetical protein [Paraburkholderia fungorum]MBB4515667.1 hypothetical protein [Paraburkholderia fungorum]MBB6203917.1 hypothetical protein [Paraburkholderia fungorum]MBU7438537.1 hypothetical protein [Paraburkholderia fungorum]